MPLGEPALDRRHVTDAAAKLHRHLCGRQNRVDRRAVDRAALEGTVEVDHVQALEAGFGEGARLGARIAVEGGRLGHVALDQANAGAVLEVDGGKQDHGAHSRKLAISLRPSFWLFSGWNWVPAMVPRATIAVTGPP